MKTTLFIIIINLILISNFSSLFADESNPKFTTLQEVASKQLGINISDININTDLNKFNADSTDIYNIITTVCSILKIEIPSTTFDWNKFNQVAEIINYLNNHSIYRYNRRGRMMMDEESASPPANSYLKNVYYVTNRKPTGDKNREEYFSGKRSTNGKTSQGIVEVSIPRNHKKGKVEASFLGLKFFHNSSNHFKINSIKNMNKKDFFASLDLQKNDTLLYIHGFNVTFKNSAKQIAQMAFDYEFPGKAMMFSWPSDGKLLAYTSDREDARWSQAHLAQTLIEVSNNSLANSKIHIIAHSMGNQVLIGALNRVSTFNKINNENISFENIILAAPDFDAELFTQQIAPEIGPLSKNWTIYSSDKDKALTISSKINQAKRLGTPITPIQEMDVIDASGIEITPWNVAHFHSYYSTKKVIIDDLTEVIINGTNASRRSKLKKIDHNTIPYYVFE